jgi:predicted PurR-regulated permease PerM
MTVQDRITQDITRTTLAVLFIGILITASVWILQPFLTAIVWAMIIAVATWPILLKLQKVLWGRRGLAVAVMTIILLLVVMAPLIAAISIIVSRVDAIASVIKSPDAFAVPPLPEWASTIPFVGRRLAEQWQYYSSLAPEELAAFVIPHARTVINWFLAQAGSLTTIMLQFLLTVIIAAAMYSGGEKAAAGITNFARRLAGQNGEEIVMLVAKAVRSVAVGIVVTAIVQTAIGGTGLFISGIPAPGLLTAVVFILCLAQLGPILVLLPSMIWLYWKGEPLWGTIMLIFLIVANTIDNFLRPMLIKKGVDLPLIIIFTGVIGGLISCGAIGLFIGPVVLAVAYTLAKAWILEDNGQLPVDVKSVQPDLQR